LTSEYLVYRKLISSRTIATCTCTYPRNASRRATLSDVAHSRVYRKMETNHAFC